MQVRFSPSHKPLTRAHGTGLGLSDFSFSDFSTSLAKIAPELTKIYTTKATLDTQVKLAQAQAQYGMTGQFNAPMSQIPPWVVPAGILGGMAVLSFALMRR